MKTWLIACTVWLLGSIAAAQGVNPPITLTKPSADAVVDVAFSTTLLPSNIVSVDVVRNTPKNPVCHIEVQPWTCTWKTNDVGSWMLYALGKDATGTILKFSSTKVTISVVVPPTPPLPPVVILPSPLAPRTMIVVNTLSPTSMAVAGHYALVRGIPVANLCPIATIDPGWEYVPAPVADGVVAGVQGCVTRIGKEKVLYIVMMPGVPHMVWKDEGASIDNRIAALWHAVGSTRILNPYKANDQTFAGTYAPFISLAEWRLKDVSGTPIYSVWRLWGTIEAANKMVDDGIQAEATGQKGKVCIDARTPIFNSNDFSYAAGDNDLIQAANIARLGGLVTVFDGNFVEFGTAPAPLRCDDVAFYAGWYSYAEYHDVFSFAQGAVGFHMDSGSCVWSLNALARGLSVTSCVVAEPFVDALPHPDGIMRDLLAGATVGDAFFRHTDHLNWKTLQFGDPLRTFKRP